MSIAINKIIDVGLTWRRAVRRRLFRLELVVELGEVSQDGETVGGVAAGLAADKFRFA